MLALASFRPARREQIRGTLARGAATTRVAAIEAVAPVARNRIRERTAKDIA